MTINEYTRSISMIRGDDETLLVRRSGPDGSALPFAPGEVLTLTVREDAESDILLQLRSGLTTEGEALFTIAHADTAALDFGRYVYDIQHTGAEGRITTYVPLSRFILQKEVTY